MANRRKTVLTGSRGSNRTAVSVDYKAMIEAAAQRDEVDISDWGGTVTVSELAALLRVAEGTARRIISLGVQERGIRFRKRRPGRGAVVAEYSAADVYNVVDEMQKQGKLAVRA